MIIRKTGGRVLKTNGQRVEIPIEVELQYDEDHDPFAVTMVVFEEGKDEGVSWVFSRELLMRGSCSRTPFGTGDIRFRYLGGDGLIVCLKNAEGHADFETSQGDVIKFLNATCEAVPVGEEDVEDSVDDLIRELGLA